MPIPKSITRFVAGLFGTSAYIARFAEDRVLAERLRSTLSQIYTAVGVTAWRGRTIFYEDSVEILFQVPSGTFPQDYPQDPSPIIRATGSVAAVPVIATVGSTVREIGWRLFTQEPIMKAPEAPASPVPIYYTPPSSYETYPATRRAAGIPMDVALSRGDSDFRIEVGTTLEENEPYLLDFTKFSGMLLSGVSGYGKSNFLHVLALQFANKENVQLAFIDPKRVEFMAYKTLSNLYRPIAKDFAAAMDMLRAVFNEMQSRYQMLEDEGLRKLPLDRKTIILIVDEFQDFSVEAQADKAAFEEMQQLLLRIISKGRAAGIKTILSAPYMLNGLFKDGLIKGNMGVRVVFRLPRKENSVTIAGIPGAEELSHGQALIVNDDGTNAKVGVYFADDETIRAVV